MRNQAVTVFMATFGVLMTLADVSEASLIVSFDLGGGTAYTGDGPAGTPAVNWAQAPGPGSGPYVDGATGIGLRVFNGTGFISNAGGGLRGLTDNFVYDGTGGNPGIQTANFEITGLNDALVYDIYFVAPNGQQFGAGNIYGGVYRVGGLSATASGSLNTDTVWTEGQNYADLRGLGSSAGVIAGTYEENPANLNPNNFGIAGIQITIVVPEPTTSLILLGLVSSLVFGRRRRRVCPA